MEPNCPDVISPIVKRFKLGAVPEVMSKAGNWSSLNEKKPKQKKSKSNKGVMSRLMSNPKKSSTTAKVL